MTGAEVRIVSETANELPIGETGDLWYRSPYTFRGYLEDPGITLAVSADSGWLKKATLPVAMRTGTIAY